MATASDNFRRLREAGIIRTDEVPEEYLAVIDSLEAPQVDVILDGWERLQAAGGEPRPGEDPLFTTYIWY